MLNVPGEKRAGGNGEWGGQLESSVRLSLPPSGADDNVGLNCGAGG